jgi:hypothetical protein
VPSLTALLGLVAMYGYVCLAGVVFVAAARALSSANATIWSTRASVCSAHRPWCQAGAT